MDRDFALGESIKKKREGNNGPERIETITFSFFLRMKTPGPGGYSLGTYVNHTVEKETFSL